VTVRHSGDRRRILDREINVAYYLPPPGQGGISGRLGNSNATYAGYRGNYLIRAQPIVPNPQTTDQQATRAALSYLAKNWQTLTATQRATWNAAAANADVKTRVGTTMARTGLTLYIGLGLPTILRTGSYTATSLPTEAQGGTVTISSTSIDISDGNITFEVTSLGIPTGSFIEVRATAAASSPAINPQPSSYRLICGANPDSFMAATSGPASYSFPQSKFAYAEGQLVGLEVRGLSAHGWPTLPNKVVQFTVIP
jgi:hypothetical protein